MVRRQLAPRVGLVAIAMLVASCDPATRIAIDPESRAPDVSFVLSSGATSRPATVAAFRVDRCEARGSPTPESHWLTLAPSGAEPISRITYGVPPTGWRSTQGPQPMAPGCYRAAVASAPPLEFDVLADGDVKTRR